ncbi:MAG TPA: hypothetical protein VLI71_07195, partial [Gammaproteobacteria bacterium]|nr:hypothetical protein [Gammaproteobacteria bacterium]
GYESVDVPGSEEQSEWAVSRSTVYAEVRLVPQLLSLYADQKIAPDDSENREAYLLLTPLQGKITLKAGQMFVPFGLRLQDDETFVRQATGVNFLTPDDGVEVGLELAKWSAQLAVIEGENGADDQLSSSAVYVQPKWRIGASINTSEDAFGDRTMQSVFGGLKTGPISWLAELSLIADEAPAGDNDSYATLLEGNYRLGKGHNVKLGYEFLEPNEDRDEDEQERYSLVWEYNPIQFVQSRVGVRRYNGIPNITASNRDELFAELHVYF